jgi:CHRD domain
MKRQLAASAVAFLSSYAATMPVNATTTTFTSILSSAGEPVPTSTATGAVAVTFDDALNSVTVVLSFANLANNAPFAHIHCCTAITGAGSAPVALSFTAFPALSTGSYVSAFNLSAGSFSSLLLGTAAGKAYVNIHTPGTYAAGEIRGFLPAAAVTPVPESETYALMLAGLGVVAWAARRRPV